MSIQNTLLVPEIQYFMERVITQSELNKSQTLAPANAAFLDPDSRSFIRLLFDDQWPLDFSFYYPLFTQIDKSECPALLRQRLMLYPMSAKYYMVSSTGDVNLFNLQNDDFHLLAALLEFRTQETHFQFDQYNFSDLTTPLSKLIYIFLDLKINDRDIYYDNDVVLSDEGDVLVNCYEFYIQELLFDYFSKKGN